ncbi:MAG: hypothetical protein IJT04_05430 [Bacteroidales bacterium]|nr:hypothetical protein [Bacteroidales bacterium]
MELILTEWLGADGSFVSLFDDLILDLNADQFYDNIPENEIERISKRIKNKNKAINDLVKQSTNVDNILLENDIDNWNNVELITKTIKEKLKKGLKRKIEPIINENIEQIIKKTNEINDRHKNGDSKKNPICEIKKIGGEYFVWTYQYAAEFEIPLENDKKEKKDSLKIRIEPRKLVTTAHYNKMLASVFNFQVMDHISGQKSSSFILFYLMAFLSRVTQTIQRGVYREYVDREENLHYLKERLLIADRLRENRFSPDRIYCAFSELSSDNIINQTINQTLNCIKRVYKNSEIQTRIRKIQNRLDPDELSNTPVSLSQIKAMNYNRSNKPYEEIMGYCYNILQNIGGSFGSANDMKYAAFYVDMNELFETYVGKLLSKKDTETEGIIEIWTRVCDDENTWDDYYVETQDRGRYYLAEDGGAFNQEIRPDFLIKKRGKDGEDDSVVAVLDTKYKRLSNRRDLHYGIHREDMYQVITYGYRFNTDKLFLIYPKSPEYSQDNLISITIPSKEGESKTLYIAYVNLLKKPN